MRGQTQAARARLEGLAAGPAEAAGTASSLEAGRRAILARSIELEQRMHASQSNYLAAAAATPAPVPRDGVPASSARRTPDREQWNPSASLPPWFTGEDPPTARERHESNARAAAQRRAEMDEINDQANGHFENLGVGAKTYSRSS